jgi:hypothetical protein
VATILTAIPKRGAVLWLWQSDFFRASMFIVYSIKFGAVVADGEG